MVQQPDLSAYIADEYLKPNPLPWTDGDGHHTQEQPPEPEGSDGAGIQVPKGLLSSWAPFTLHDAYQERPPLKYLAGRLFEIPSLNSVWGSPGSLKSMFMAYMACCVAAGCPCLPPLPGEDGAALPVMQGPVVWLDFDNGRRRTHDRFEAIGRALNLPEDTPLFYYSMPTPWLDMRNKAMVGEVAGILKEHHALFSVIDNLGTISGGVDENSSEMIPIMGHLAWLREYTEGVVTFMHHNRKNFGFKTRKGENMRGHSSIEQMLDLALFVDRPDEHKGNIVVSDSKTRGAEVPAFGAQFAFEARPDGSLYKASFYATTVTSDELLLFSTIRTAILRCLKPDEEVKKGELITRAQNSLQKIGEKRIANTIDALVEQRVLLVHTGPHQAQMISRNTKDDDE